ESTDPTSEVSISLGLPKSVDEFRRCEYYQLVTRGGNAIRKAENDRINEFERKQVRMLAEGAVLTLSSQTETETTGRIADLKPQDAVMPLWRNGIFFTLGL
ncbi:MAG: hypothetical protein AAF570_14380, partial [Bacteroidota bacterium]